MSETVFILGAGASKPTGAPLLSGFLDAAESLRSHGSVEDAKEDFALVFDAIATLQQVHSKADLDLDNLEDVFGAFEMAKLLRRLGNLDESIVDRLPDAMRRVIERTLTVSVRFPFTEEQIRPQSPYAELVRLIRESTSPIGARATSSFRMRRPGDFSVMTFNYDVCADYAFHFNGIGVNYCLGSFIQEGTVPLLKLHGSLNWFQCKDCGEVISISFQERFHGTYWGLSGEKHVTIPFNYAGHACPACRTGKLGPAYLVPPTWSKFQWHTGLASVWRAAARELAEAENIFVCGYSLPDTDQFFRYLYALGTVGQARLKRVWIVNTDPNVKRRFERLIGRGAMNRFRFIEQPFEEAFGDLRPVFGLTTN